MEWRLLHGAAHGSPWFGRWGYEFGRGSFGVTETMYNKAIEAIQSIPLPHLSTGTTTPIFSKYQTLSTPNHPLKNLRDLFCFLLDLKPHLASNSSSRDRDSDTANTCRWSAKRVEMAARVIVEALRRAEFRWVTRQQVRDAARAYIGDTGLLDYVLKSLGNRVVGNFLVRRSLNPVTKVLEYSLVDVSCVAFPGTPPQQMNSITRSQLMKDLFYLYKSILLGQQKPKQNAAVFAAIPVAARIILDTKLLIKEYCGDHQHSPPLRSDLQLEREGSSTIYCTFRLKRKDESSNPEDKDEEASKNPPPPLERFILKGDKSTIADLKRDVEERFRDTYLGLKDLAVESIENPNNTVNGSDRVLDAVKPGCDKIVFEANSGGGEEIQYECGGKNGDWEMDCRCGAEGDDGERMICCDICGVWQHSRCVGFPNNEEIPNMFLCGRCEQELVVSPSLP